MRKLSLKKISFIGMILAAASTVTAFVSSKTSERVTGFAGILLVSTHENLTCKPLFGGIDCTATINSTTTRENFSSEPVFGHSNDSSPNSPDGDGNTTIR